MYNILKYSLMIWNGICNIFEIITNYGNWIISQHSSTLAWTFGICYLFNPILYMIKVNYLQNSEPIQLNYYNNIAKIAKVDLNINMHSNIAKDILENSKSNENINIVEDTILPPFTQYEIFKNTLEIKKFIDNISKLTENKNFFISDEDENKYLNEILDIDILKTEIVNEHEIKQIACKIIKDIHSEDKTKKYIDRISSHNIVKIKEHIEILLNIFNVDGIKDKEVLKKKLNSLDIEEINSEYNMILILIHDIKLQLNNLKEIFEKNINKLEKDFNLNSIDLNDFFEVKDSSKSEKHTKINILRNINLFFYRKLYEIIDQYMVFFKLNDKDNIYIKQHRAILKYFTGIIDLEELNKKKDKCQKLLSSIEKIDKQIHNINEEVIETLRNFNANNSINFERLTKSVSELDNKSSNYENKVKNIVKFWFIENYLTFFSSGNCNIIEYGLFKLINIVCFNINIAVKASIYFYLLIFEQLPSCLQTMLFNKQSRGIFQFTSDFINNEDTSHLTFVEKLLKKNYCFGAISNPFLNNHTLDFIEKYSHYLEFTDPWKNNNNDNSSNKILDINRLVNDNKEINSILRTQIVFNHSDMESYKKKVLASSSKSAKLQVYEQLKFIKDSAIEDRNNLQKFRNNISLYHQVILYILDSINFAISTDYRINYNYPIAFIIDIFIKSVQYTAVRLFQDYNLPNFTGLFKFFSALFGNRTNNNQIALR